VAPPGVSMVGCIVRAYLAEKARLDALNPPC
jgi:hypothetical protein